MKTAAMITIDQTGRYGSHAKLAIALIAATITPTVRPHTAPLKTPKPAKRTMTPPMRWIHPQLVVTNSRMYSCVRTNVSSLMIAPKPTMAWNTPIMINMTPAKVAQPTAQPLGSSCCMDIASFPLSTGRARSVTSNAEVWLWGAPESKT